MLFYLWTHLTWFETSIKQCPQLGVTISLQVLAYRFSDTWGEHFLLSYRQVKKLGWIVSDWWLSKKFKASSSTAVLFVTVKGTIISWRWGIIIEFKGLAAATENSITQKSPQNQPSLSPTHAKEDGWTRKEEGIVVSPLPASAPCFLSFLPVDCFSTSLSLSIWLRYSSYTQLC